MIPFTIEEFLDVFRRYNEAVWPVQWLLLAGACLAIGLVIRSGPRSSRGVGLVLSLLWLWMGVAYHLAYFRAINPAAVGFAALFVVQAALFAWLVAWRGRLAFRVRMDAGGLLGAALTTYALVVYPALGSALGHRYPAAPTFGLPCPTTIFTLGLLVWTRPPVPRVLLVIPGLWSLLGASAAAQLGMREDLGLVAAAVLAVPFVLARDRAAHAAMPDHYEAHDGAPASGRARSR